MASREAAAPSRELPTLRIFLSSPDDVAKEQAFARHFIDSELPKNTFLRERVKFELVVWNDPAAQIPMLATQTPQASVNAARPRPADCDIVIVILWSRMGTPLPKTVLKPNKESYLSGTEWEYENAVNSPRQPRPRVYVYRRIAEPNIKHRDPDFAEKREQFERLESFFARFKNDDGSLKGAIHQYETLRDFQSMLRQHLQEVVFQILQPSDHDGGSPRYPRKPRTMVNISSGDSDRRLAIGVDVGTTKIAAGLVNLQDQVDPSVSSLKKVYHDDIGHEKQIIEKIYEAIWNVMQDAGIGRSDLDHVGVGLPGQVNSDSGCMTFAPGLKLRNVPLAGELRRKLNVPVLVDNDVNCSTIAEQRFGEAGRRYRDFVCIFIGSGIGAGIVINDQLVRGHGFAAGEVGHMKIDCSERSRPCTCGGNGCLEEYASARAIIRLARDRIHELRDRKEPSLLRNLDPDTFKPEDLIKPVNSRDESAVALAEHVGRYLGLGVGNIINILNPQAVVLGGGIIDGLYCGCDLFRNAVSEGIKGATLDVCSNTAILTAERGPDTPIIGAAALGCRFNNAPA